MLKRREGYILRSYPRSDWERWTIDEKTDGHVRVLVAQTQSRQQVERLRQSMQRSDPTGREAERTARLRVVAMALEQDDEAWSDEVEFFFEESALEEFLNRRRRGKPGLPGARPLREGDVFYVEIPAEVQWRPSSEEVQSTPGVAREMLSSFMASGVEVWDLTAAARQASKLDYHRALEAPAPEDKPRG